MRKRAKAWRQRIDALERKIDQMLNGQKLRAGLPARWWAEQLGVKPAQVANLKAYSTRIVKLRQTLPVDRMVEYALKHMPELAKFSPSTYNDTVLQRRSIAEVQAAWPKREGDDQKPTFLPPPDEIRRRCLEIQATWTDTERRHRAMYRPRPVEIHSASYSQCDVF